MRLFNRRFTTLALALLIILLLSACSGRSENTKSKVADLTGTWEQSNKNAETSFQAASISGNVIEVYWINTVDDTKALYWAGTYVAPTETNDAFSWDSQNDKSKTYNALLASDDDTKTFTYDKGVLSYSVSALGVTTTVKLSKTSDTPSVIMVNNGDSADINSSTSELLPLELVESGWAVKDGFDKYYIQYAIVIKNPNSANAVKYPHVRLTARDANGGVLGTHEMVGNSILPDETWVGAFQGPSCDSEPATVDFNIIQPDDSYWIDPSRLDYSGDPLTILNTTKRSDKITGEISNSNDYDISTAAVTVIFRDAEGKISYGETTYVDGVLGGTTTPFELSMWGAEEFMTDSFEVYAIPWM